MTRVDSENAWVRERIGHREACYGVMVVLQFCIRNLLLSASVTLDPVIRLYFLLSGEGSRW